MAEENQQINELTVYMIHAWPFAEVVLIPVIGNFHIKESILKWKIEIEIMLSQNMVTSERQF